MRISIKNNDERISDRKSMRFSFKYVRRKNTVFFLDCFAEFFFFFLRIRLWTTTCSLVVSILTFYTGPSLACRPIKQQSVLELYYVTPCVFRPSSSPSSTVKYCTHATTPRETRRTCSGGRRRLRTPRRGDDARWKNSRARDNTSERNAIKICR